MIAAVIILVIAGAIARFVTDVLTPMLGAVAGGRWIARAAGIAILIVGVFAALDQLNIAPVIVTGLFYGLLVALVGSIVVAFGGGGIPVAREYLGRWSTRAQLKTEEIKDSVQMNESRQPEAPMPPAPMEPAAPAGEPTQRL